MSLLEGKSLCIFPLKELSSNHERWGKRLKWKDRNVLNSFLQQDSRTETPSICLGALPAPGCCCLCPEGAPPQHPGLWVRLFTPKAVSLVQTLPLPRCEVPWGWAQPFSDIQVPTHHTIDQRALKLHPGKSWECPRVPVSDTQHRPSQCTGEVKCGWNHSAYQSQRGGKEGKIACELLVMLSSLFRVSLQMLPEEAT